MLKKLAIAVVDKKNPKIRISDVYPLEYAKHLKLSDDEKIIKIEIREIK